MIAADNIGMDHYLYTGPKDGITRPFCRPLINKVVDKTQLGKLNNGQGLSVRTSGGGYNCRHSWSPVTESFMKAAGLDKANASALELPYRQGFVKNRYIGRTFIMPGQTMRKKSVRRKLNAISSEFKGKSVLLVDDSIVRGTTSGQIIEMARESGAKKVYFASAAPEIRFPNVYGIDMPSANELIAYGREIDQIAELIQADGLIFQDISDLVAAVREENEAIGRFETSVFDGNYITADIDQEYLERIDMSRGEKSREAPVVQAELSNLDVHNIDASD